MTSTEKSWPTSSFGHPFGAHAITTTTIIITIVTTGFVARLRNIFICKCSSKPDPSG